MLLHDADDPSPVAAGFFRPLWDSNLRVGHSVRSVTEASAAAKERFETHTTLLTCRFVAGSQELFDRLTAEVASVTKARPLRSHLVAEERERRRQSPYLLMATDVKNGRGGLRTLQGFEWVQRREELIGRFSQGASPEEQQAYETLLTIRNALHAKAGRAYDVFSYDLREPVAVWLDADVYDVASRLMEAVEAADRLATSRWPELADENGSGKRRLWHRLRARPANIDTGAPLSAGELAEVLRSGERGRLALEKLREAGRLTEVLPEWDTVRALPQLAPFHEHSVEAHLWRTVDEMQAIVEDDKGHYSAVAASVDDPDLLTMAAFLHDIGKGQGGDHSEIGAGIARSVCVRLGFPEEISDLVEGAVRHHLLLGQTATRRDIDDPDVVDEVVRDVGSLRLLQVLYLLAVADSRATGPTMWNDWKSQLLRTLFHRCAERFEPGLSEQPESGMLERALASASPQLRPAVAAHLDRVPREYTRSTSPADVVWHVGLIEGLEGWSNLDKKAGEPVDTVVMVGRERGDFRRIVAEVFAANGVDVLEARLGTRADGIIVDSFQVRDDRTGGRVPEQRWDLVRHDVESALSGELDTGSKVAVRADAYSSVTTRNGVEPRVSIALGEVGSDGVITVKCSDRIGRLAEILAVLGESGIDIRLAKLDSRGGELVDTFHVRADSLPADAELLEELRRRIEESL